MKKPEQDVERPFVVDGIKEYDNPLPSWWVSLFILTIIFAVVYLLVVHGLDGPSLHKELMADRKAYQEQTSKNSGLQSSAAGLADELQDPALIAQGKGHYTTNCAPCHGVDGGGVVGPNLTDKYWLHGGRAEDIIKSISDGIPAKGMIAWKNILGPKKIKEVTAYVKSLAGGQPASPKAPEGDIYDGP